MILGGDEFARSQRGNNNAYCQDNEINWFDWTLHRAQRGDFRFLPKGDRVYAALSGTAASQVFARQGPRRRQRVGPYLVCAGLGRTPMAGCQHAHALLPTRCQRGRISISAWIVCSLFSTPITSRNGSSCRRWIPGAHGTGRSIRAYGQREFHRRRPGNPRRSAGSLHGQCAQHGSAARPRAGLTDTCEFLEMSAEDDFTMKSQRGETASKAESI